MVLPGQQSFAVRNDAAGWAELVARLRGTAVTAIGLEASGGYERGAMRALLAAGLPACSATWPSLLAPTPTPSRQSDG
jgi:transposase